MFFTAQILYYIEILRILYPYIHPLLKFSVFFIPKSIIYISYHIYFIIFHVTNLFSLIHVSTTIIFFYFYIKLLYKFIIHYFI
jgi:hypothetical protein